MLYFRNNFFPKIKQQKIKEIEKMPERFNTVKISLLFLTIFAFMFSAVSQINAQSQALNGKIEGTVTDANGAAIPNASVLLRNIETGAERQVATDADGVYRAPLLPLGTYRITVEVPNFKRLVREGITLTTGQIATVDLKLEAGDIAATLTITSDAPVADPCVRCDCRIAGRNQTPEAARMGGCFPTSGTTNPHGARQSTQSSPQPYAAA